MNYRTKQVGFVRGLLVILAATAFTRLSISGEKKDGSAAFGKPVKAFQLKDVVSDKTVRMADYKGRVLVLGWYSPGCITCPMYDARLKKFAARHLKAKKVSLLIISSNSMDSPAKLRAHAKQRKFNFPVLRDGDASLAKYYGIDQTCTFVVIDSRGRMQFRGGFDDDRDADTVEHHYVEDSVKAILAGTKVKIRHSDVLG